MLLKYSETDSSTVSLLEVSKAECYAVKYENKTKWVVSFLSTETFERVDVYVGDFQKGMSLIDQIFKNNFLDITSDPTLLVQCEFVYSSYLSDPDIGEEDEEDYSEFL